MNLFDDDLQGAAPRGAPGVRGDTPGAGPERRIWTVSRLNQEVQRALEKGFGTIWLEGELSNVSRPASGHLYFSIKDSHAQIRCAMFKGRNRYVDFRPENGDQVLVRGKLGLYAARGDFQLIVEHMEPAGVGRLQAAFEARKRELDALGWFAVDAKRALPTSPVTIGIVTSPTGAAVRDVLHVLERRYPQGRVIIYPTVTQGAQSAPAIAAALATASRRHEVDVLLLVRGGGSLEDLWAFNELIVAAAIRDCPIPVVAGVGHEVDVTIADLVADLRAPTPSAAAELATPDGAALGRTAIALGRSLTQSMLRRISQSARHARSLEDRLTARHPERLLVERARHVDELEARLVTLEESRRLRRRERIDHLVARLEARHPRRLVEFATRRHDGLERQLVADLERRISRSNNALSVLERWLDAGSPAVRVAGLVSRQQRLALRLAGAMQTALARRDARFRPLDRSLAAVGPMAVMARGYAVLSTAAPARDHGGVPGGDAGGE